MPWTPADADRHKKGLSARQRRQWSAVANSALRRCLAEGRSQATCEASAIRQANGAVGAPELSTEQATCHRALTINTVVTVPPARMVLNAQEYLTAPVVMIVEGVMNQGLIPGEELQPTVWNGVPITLGHPLNDAGIPHSARQPHVLATCGVGHVYHTSLSTGQRQGHPVTSLRGELWINLADVQRCGEEAQQAVAMLETQTPLEVSTAFFSEAARVQGSFYGVPYSEVHRHLQPDHLALLPNSVGACSIADGCGAPRLHEDVCACGGLCAACQDKEMVSMDDPPRFWTRLMAMLRLSPHANGTDVLTIEQTDMDIRDALYGALAREMGDNIHMTPYFIQDLDVAEQSFTYREGERLKRRKWQMEEGLLVLAPEVEDVQRSTTYTPVPVTQEHQDPPQDTQEPPHTEEEPPMAGTLSPHIKRRVDALIANPRTRWTEAERHHLEGMSEALLIILEQQPLASEPAEPVTFEDLLAKAPKKMQENFAENMEIMHAREAAAIAIIKAQPIQVFTDEKLKTMDLKELEGIAALLGADVPHMADYRGRGLATPRRQIDPDTLPPDPPKTAERVLARQKELGKGAFFR